MVYLGNSLKYFIVCLCIVLLATSVSTIAYAKHHKSYGKHHYLKKLPRHSTKVSVSVGTGPVYVSSGHYYRHTHRGYYRTHAPIGLTISYLPRGYSRYRVGGHIYYHLHDTYYRWRPHKRDYIVVEEPVGEQVAFDNNESDSNYQALIFYPAAQQSEKQLENDQYACHKWANKQSGFDPSRVNVKSATDAGKPGEYNRAMSACMEAKNYVVK